MTRHKIVKSKDFQRLVQDLQHEGNISETYSEYESRFIDVLTQFFYMWDKHLGRIRIEKYRIKLLSNVNLVHSAPYRADLTLREFQRFEIEKELLENFIKSAQIMLTAPIFFAPEKDGSTRFCIDYRKLNNVI